MADPAKTARWRCPACGTSLDPVAPNGSGVIRFTCPDCGGQFRVRKKDDTPGEPASSVFSGEVPAVRTEPPPPIIGGFGLAWRSGILRVIPPILHVGNFLGGTTLFLLGGFVPVIRGWMNDEVSDLTGAFRTLGGVPVSSQTKDPDADLGPAISRGDAPELFTEVAEVARRLGAKPPEQIRLTYLPCCGVMAWGRSRGLVIGLPLLQVLTRSELRAVLAHEMAHLARGDATSAADGSRFVQSLNAAMISVAPSLSPLRIWARLCGGIADRLHAPIAWGQEARADRAAASIAGGDVAASALVKVAAVQPLFREVLDAFEPSNDMPNLYAFFRSFWARLPESLFTAIRHKLLSEGEVSPDPAHPPLLDRIAAVQAYPHRPAMESDSLLASTMLGDPEAFEAMLHNRLFSVNRVEPSVFHRRR